MKKQIIPNLGRIIGKAVIVAAMACPILFSSCDKFIYDDTELKESIADLNERLTALEQKMNEQIATLTSLVNSKITVTEISTDEQSGKTVITLSDGKTVTVYPEAEMPDLSGLSFMTVKEENGVYYWAVGSYGKEPEFLLINDQKVPVVAEKEEIKLQGKIEDGKYYVSIDGGETWVETGITPKEDVDVFVSYEQDDDYVYLTLADGTVIKVAKDKELVFSVVQDEIYMTYGRTQTVRLKMQGVLDYTITEKPEGWKASINEGYVTNLLITAPKEGADADVDGYIKILATFKDASPVIAKVYVHVEPDFVISRNFDNISIKLAEVNVNNWDYYGYVYGVMPYKDFSLKAAVEYFTSNNPTYSGSKENLETTISELVGPDFEKEASYVVFASNYKFIDYDEKYTEEDIKYVVYAPIKLNVEITPSIDNANLNLSFSGCDAIYAGFDYAEYYSKESVLSDLTSQYFAPEPVTESYDGPIGKFNGGYYENLDIDKDYVFWVVIKNDNGEYTEEDIKEYPFSTLPLVLGGSLAAPEIVVDKLTSSSITATVTVVEGCYKTYAYVFEKGGWNYPENEADRLNTLLSYGTRKNEGTIELTKQYLQPGTELEICAVAIDKDGNVGTIAQKEVTTPGLSFSESLGVTIKNVETSMTSAKITFEFTGDVSTIKYVSQTTDYGSDDMENNLALGTAYPTEVSVSSLTDNTLELTGLSVGTKYYFYVMAFNADGEFSHMAQTTFEPKSTIVYVKKNEADWAYGKPEIGNEVWGEDAWQNYYGTWYPSNTTLDVTVTLPAECKKVYLWAKDPAYLTTDTAVTLSDKIVAYGVPVEESGSVRVNDYANNSVRVYFVWVDNNDKYHIYDEYIPTFPAQPAE